MKKVLTPLEAFREQLKHGRPLTPEERGERAEAQERRVERNRQAAEPVLGSLRQHGFDVANISDLPMSKARYDDAIPVLVEWLPKVKADDVKEDIVRALSVPFSGPKSISVLLAEFKRTAPGNLRWAIGNGIGVLAAEAVASDLLEVASNDRYGRDRQMVVLALAKVKDPRVPGCLIGLLKDEDVRLHAIIALGKAGAPEGLEPVRRFIDDPDSEVRREARKATKRLERR